MAGLPYQQRPRSALLAQILSQMQQQPHRISSYGQLAAELGAEYLKKKTYDKAMSQEQAEQQAQAQALAESLSQYQSDIQGSPGFEMQSVPGMSVGSVPGDQDFARRRLMASTLQSGHPAAAMILPELMKQEFGEKKPPKMVERVNPDGTKSIVPEAAGVITFRPDKWETLTDAQERERGLPTEGSYQRHTLTDEIKAIGGRGQTINVDVNSDFGTKAKGDLETSLIQSAENLAQLRTISGQFDSEFLTYVGKLKAGGATALDKLGIAPEAAQDYLDRYTQFTANSIDQLNNYIKQVTGAQMTIQEADRIRKGMPDAERDSPTQFKSKMDQVVGKLTRVAVRAKLARMLDQPIENFSIESVDTMVERYGNQKEQEFIKQGFSQKDAESMAKRAVEELVR